MLAHDNLHILEKKKVIVRHTVIYFSGQNISPIRPLLSLVNIYLYESVRFHISLILLNVSKFNSGLYMLTLISRYLRCWDVSYVFFRNKSILSKVHKLFKITLLNTIQYQPGHLWKKSLCYEKNKNLASTGLVARVVKVNTKNAFTRTTWSSKNDDLSIGHWLLQF